MSAALSPVPRQTFFANDGTPLNGGLVYTYAAGTLTPKTMYSDTGLSVPISNPIVLNSAGRPQASAVDTTEVGLYPQSGSYKWIVKTSLGATVWTQDDIPSVAIVSGTVTSVGLSMPSIFTVANSPITSTGTLAVTNTPNTVGGLCDGRLTLTSGTAVTTADVTAATSVYFTPYKGNLIDLFDGSSVWNSRRFTELTLALGTLTASLPYDIFAYDNSGVVALRSPVAWTSATARATALTLQDGVYVKTGATTDRYLGTFYTTATTTTEDSYAKRNLWNYYNRVERPMRVVEGTDSWTYTTATYRQARATATNQLEFVIGVAEILVKGQIVSWSANAANDGTTQVVAQVAIGEDSTTTPDALCQIIGQGPQTAAAVISPYGTRTAWLQKYPAVGRHVWVWLERSAATNTTTWYGDNGDSTLFQAGIFGSLFS